MPVVPLAIGRGLQRSDGLGAIGPDTARDVRHLIVSGSVLVLRRGLSLTPWPAVPWGTDILLTVGFEYKKDLLHVVYDRSTRELRIYRINPVGPTVQNAGTWGTLGVNAKQPPILHATESFGRVFFAHDEPSITQRLATIYYTPDALDANVGTLTTWQADLDQSGAAADVKFAGVYAWREYMLGWGYNNETSTATQDEPGTLRVSTPGDVLDLPPDDWIPFGVRQDRILAVAAAGPESQPVILKGSEVYTLEGRDSYTFVPILRDPLHGIAGAHLWARADGNVVFWSNSGPRLYGGDEGPTVDLEYALGLHFPDPAGFEIPSNLEYGWAYFDELDRLVEFGFPDMIGRTIPTRSVIGSLRASEPPQWTYAERPLVIACATIAPLNKTTPPPVNAYASAVSLADAGISADNASRKGTVAWTNNTYDGDEFVQIFARKTGSGGTGWSLRLTVQLSGATQNAVVSGLDAITAYDVALRMVRGGEVKTGYEDSSNPDNWTGATVAGAKASGNLSVSTPVITSTVWSRVSPTATQILVTWTLADLNAPVSIERRINAGAYSEVGTLAGPATPHTFAYDSSADAVGATIDFRVRGKNGALVGTYSNVLGTQNGYGTTISLQQIVALESDLVTFFCDAVDLGGWDRIEVEWSADGVTGWTLGETFSNPTPVPARLRFILTGVKTNYGLTSGQTTARHFRATIKKGSDASPVSNVIGPRNMYPADPYPGGFSTVTSSTFPNWATTPAVYTMPITAALPDAAVLGVIVFPRKDSSAGLVHDAVLPIDTTSPLEPQVTIAFSGNRYAFECWSISPNYQRVNVIVLSVAGNTLSNPVP